MKKAELRKKCLEIRKNLPFKEANEKSLPAEVYERAQTVFIYVSSKNEIGTHRLIEKMLQDKKTVCVPYCIDSDGSMICVKISSLSELREGRFGISEPIEPEEYDKTKIELVVMPGVAFSPDGARLGYGKGYYDRFLSDISPYKIGFCHKELQRELATEAHDIRADKVIWF